MIIDSKKYNGRCVCGKEHIMQTELSVIESGCLKNADFYFEKLGISGYTVAVYDENTYKATEDRHIKADCEIILCPDNLHANEHGVDLLKNQLPENARVLVAVGSGTVHDIVRYCAYEMGADFVSCPTAASVDGFCSSVAAMTWHGCKKTLAAVAPRLVIADTDIIKNAPIRLAKSGFGDMVGKFVALTDWKIGNILVNEFYCERIADMMLEATRKVINSAKGIVTGNDSAYENLMCGLLLSGLAMQMMGNSRPASGAEHHISHMIEMLELSDAFHGEKVGVGTLIAIGEYIRLASCKDISFKDYSPFTAEQILTVMGSDKFDDIIAENEKDAASSVTAEKLRSCWDKIRDELDKLPDFTSLYEDLGVKSTLSDIDVDETMLQNLLDYSPMVRNRLTLMRLRKCL